MIALFRAATLTRWVNGNRDVNHMQRAVFVARCAFLWPIHLPDLWMPPPFRSMLNDAERRGRRAGVIAEPRWPHPL